MADLSLAQGLIAAATPRRDAVSDEFEKRRLQEEQAFKQAAGIGSQIVAPAARQIATGEFAADPERFHLLRKLAAVDPGYKEGFDKFQEFLDLREGRKGIVKVKKAPEFLKHRKEQEQFAKDEQKFRRLSDRTKKEKQRLDEKIREHTEEMKLINMRRQADIDEGVFDPERRRAYARVENRLKQRLNRLNEARQGILTREAEERPVAPRKFYGATTKEITEEASRKDLRRIRRELNRLVPGKTALRQLIAAGGRGVSGLSAKDQVPILNYLLRVGETIGKDIDNRITSTEDKIVVPEAKQAYRTLGQSFKNLMTSPDIAMRLPGGVYSAGRTTRGLVTRLSTYAEDKRAAETDAINGYSKVTRELQDIWNKTKNETTTSTVGKLTKMMVYLSMFKNMGFKNQAYERIADYAAPEALIKRVAGNDPILAGLLSTPEGQRNLSRIIKGNLDQLKNKDRIDKEVENYVLFLRQLGDELQKIKGRTPGGREVQFDFLGEAGSLDIDEDTTDDVLYKTLTGGLLGSQAPIFGPGSYEIAIEQKGDAWLWLKAMAYFMAGVENRAVFENDELMEDIVRTVIPAEVVASEDWRKGSKFFKKFEKKLYDIQKNQNFYRDPRALGSGGFLKPFVDVGKAAAGAGKEILFR